jgi:ADP-heptose:LPS heptosyltransferase
LGVQVVRWADVDLKDDQEAVAALMSQLDVVIAPQSAVEKMAIAVGVPVIIFGLKLWPSLGQEHYPWSRNAELISPDTGQPITTVLPRIMSSLQAIST